MTDFSRLSRDEQRHEMVALEQALTLKREVYRRQHGEDAMNGGSGIDVGYKGAHASIRGPLAIVAVLVALLGVGLIYVNQKGFAETNKLLGQVIVDHREIVNSQDLLSCVVSLSMEERAAVRRQGTREAFRVVCPWLKPETTR